MLGLVAAALFLVAFIVGLVQDATAFTLIVVAGLFFLALAASNLVRDRLGARARV